jgi:hypothetical protein
MLRSKIIVSPLSERNPWKIGVADAPLVPRGDGPHDRLHIGDTADTIAVMVGPVEAECRAPIVHHKHDGFRRPDDSVDEGCKIFAVGREAVGFRAGIWQFGGIAHADQIGQDQPAASLQFGNDVAPEIGRGRIAVQKQYRRSLAARVIRHAGTEHIDGLFCQRLFCHLGSCLHDQRVRVRPGRIAIGRDVENSDSPCCSRT